mmetsp:Transcript_8340/g.26668  ORF Transcript_8340/g.26668 Transcript_8340/m.26668 type:complete len:224 (-) Transcript_8340:373-1044(-)
MMNASLSLTMTGSLGLYCFFGTFSPPLSFASLAGVTPALQISCAQCPAPPSKIGNSPVPPISILQLSTPSASKADKRCSGFVTAASSVPGAFNTLEICKPFAKFAKFACTLVSDPWFLKKSPGESIFSLSSLFNIDWFLKISFLSFGSFESIALARSNNNLFTCASDSAPPSSSSPVSFSIESSETRTKYRPSFAYAGHTLTISSSPECKPNPETTNAFLTVC